jgi:hypothetical protein
MNDDRMPLGDQLAMTWEVSADRRSVRAHLPPLHLAGANRPLSIYLDMDAEGVDGLPQRLAEVRAQMLPSLKRS